MRTHPLATGLMALLLLTAMPVVGAGEAGAGDDESGPAVGTQLAADLSAHQANVETAVDDRAFDVAINESDEPATVLDQRISTLEERLTALEAEYEEFNASSASDRSPQTMKTATELEAQRHNLKHLINRTHAFAETDKVDMDDIEHQEALDRLLANVSGLEGTDVADVARTTPFPPGLGVSDRLPGPPGEHPGNASPNPGPPEDLPSDPGPPDNNSGNAPSDPGMSNESGDSPDGPPASTVPADVIQETVINSFGPTTERLVAD